MLPAVTNKTKITTKPKQGVGTETEEGVIEKVKKSFSDKRKFELTSDGKRK